MNVYNAGQPRKYVTRTTKELLNMFLDSSDKSGLLTTKNLSDLTQCKEECKKTKGCKGFNWIKPECQLLDGRLIMEDSDVPGVVAGILPCP